MENFKHKHIHNFAKQLQLSVDSRIQQTEYNMSKIIMPYVPERNQNHRTDGRKSHSLPSFQSPKLFNDKLFDMIEIYSKKVASLMYIRSKINANNAVEVSKILETEEYLTWSKNKLRAFMDKEFPNNEQHQSEKDQTIL